MRQPINAYKGALIIDGKWQPWDPVITTVLRRVINPIPMYAKKVESDIPVSDQAVGYDLVAGDWVTPYGSGGHSDWIFHIHERRVASWTDFAGRLSVTFSSDDDGFSERQVSMNGGSEFPWGHLAPASGYNDIWSVSVGYVPQAGYYQTNNSSASYFRVRTIRNEQGEIISAHYGKIPKPIEFDVRDTETGWIRFTYYLNPTPNDRNMEFDPDHNLFLNLKSLEEVTAP